MTVVGCTVIPFEPDPDMWRPVPQYAYTTNTLGIGAGERRLSDEDIERIAEAVAENLRRKRGRR